MPTSKIYVNEDEGQMLSMRGFRITHPQKLWKRCIGSPTFGMIMLGLAIGFLMGYDQATNHLHSQTLKAETLTMGGSQYDADTTPLELLGHVRKQRRDLLEKLRQDYGEFANVIMDRANLEHIFKIKDGSRARYKRKMITKILQKHINPFQKSTFTYVAAGDQRASGKGNLPIDAYSEVVKDTVKAAFSSVGLEIVTKNRAVDGYGSGPALSLCMESVYGNDIDLLSWDFGSTDGDRQYRSALWGTRATTHPTRPLLLMIDTTQVGRWKQMMRVEGKLGVAIMDTYSLTRVVKREFPDSTTKPGILPPALKYLKCNGALEGHYFCRDHPNRNFVCNFPKGETCRENKYIIEDSCKLKKYQTDWMPGWKEHRLKGRLIGSFLLSLLEDALVELDESMKHVMHFAAAERTKELLKRYVLEEEQDKFLCANSPIPDNMLGRYSDIMTELMIPLFQRPANCLLASVINAGTLPKKSITKFRVRRRLQEELSSSNETVSVSSHEHVEVTSAESNGNQGDGELTFLQVDQTPPPQPTPPPVPTLEPTSRPTPQPVIETPTPSAVPTSTSPTIESKNTDSTTAERVSTQFQEGAAQEEITSDEVSSTVDSKTAPDSETRQVDDESVNIENKEAVLIDESKGHNESVDVERIETDSTEPGKTISDGDQPRENSSSESEITVEEKEPKDKEPKEEVFVKEDSTTSSSSSEETTTSVVTHDSENPDEADVSDNNEAVEVAEANEKDKSEHIESQPKSEEEEGSSLLRVKKPEQLNIKQTKNEGELQHTEEEEEPLTTLLMDFSNPDEFMDEAVLLEMMMPSTSSDESSEDMEPEECRKVHPWHKHAFHVVREDREFSMNIQSNGDAYLMACFQTCTFGECHRPLEGLDSVKLRDGNIVIEVDGEPVGGSREMDGCHFLENEEGDLLWQTEEKTFNIRFQVKEEGGALLLFSMLAI